MTVEIITPPAMARWRDVMRPEFRRRLYAAIADKVENLVRRHILRIAPAHHIWANKLGATPTGHLTKGARLTHSTSGADYAEVIIPIPGISRAFKNLSITPKNAAALTIPIASQSYRQRAARMRQLGWTLFRPPAKGAHLTSRAPRRYDSYQDLLLGSKDGDAVPLYLLKKRVEQRQDRTLLPSDAEIGATAGTAITAVIDRIAKGAA